MDSETRCLIKYVLGEFARFGSDRPNNQERYVETAAAAAMIATVKSVLDTHGSAYIEMIAALEPHKGNVAITQVASALFADGVVNWGRVVSLVSLGAALCRSKGSGGGGWESATDTAETVGGDIASYLLEEQNEWLAENNYWDGFVAFFGKDGKDRMNSPIRTIIIIGAVLITFTVLGFQVTRI